MAANSGITISRDALPLVAQFFGMPMPDEGGTDAPDAAPAPPVDSGNDPDAVQSAQPASGPTKLDALKFLLNPTAPPEPKESFSAVPIDLSRPDVAPDAPAPIARDLSQVNLPDVQAPDVKAPSFTQEHPKVTSFLKRLASVAMNAGPGIGSSTFGEGFGIASQQPYLREQRKADIAGRQAAIQKEQAQTKSLVNMVPVTDAAGNTYHIPQAALAGFLKTNLTEEGKNKRSQAGIDSKESIANQKNVMALRAKGLKLDENGKTVPLSRDEMSESEQAAIDLKQSQTDAADAQAELNRSKNDPNSPAYKAAYGRLLVAQKNAQTAAGRLGLGRDTFNANYLGIGPQGAALPGVTTDENGNPVGPRVANSGKTPADIIRRGRLANNAIGNIDRSMAIVSKRPDLFGALSGRITNIEQLIGNDDPDLSDLGVEIHNLALASNGAHGLRSAGAVHDTEQQILNHFKNGPNAVNSALTGMKTSLQTFVDDEATGGKPNRKPAASATIPASAAAQLKEGHITTFANGQKWTKKNGKATQVP